MARSILTKPMLEMELKRCAKYEFYMSQIHIDRLSLYIHFAAMEDREILTIIYDTETNRKTIDYGLKSNDLLMSLDDFLDRNLKPMIAKIADDIGYATWD